MSGFMTNFFKNNALLSSDHFDTCLDYFFQHHNKPACTISLLPPLLMNFNVKSYVWSSNMSYLGLLLFYTCKVSYPQNFIHFMSFGV